MRAAYPPFTSHVVSWAKSNTILAGLDPVYGSVNVAVVPCNGTADPAQQFLWDTDSGVISITHEEGPSFSFCVLGLPHSYPDRAAAGPHFVPGLPHVTLIELHLALISYQYRMLP